jgi:hypothetical protein
MSSETDRLGERVAGIEGTVGQMNERLGTIEGRLDTMSGRIDTVDGKIDEAKRDVRRWLALVVLATSLLTSIVIGFLQVLL